MFKDRGRSMGSGVGRRVGKKRESMAGTTLRPKVVRAEGRRGRAGGTLSAVGGRYNQIEREVKRLKRTDFSIEEFYHHQLVDHLYMLVDKAEIMRMAQKRAEKWWRKRGEEFGEEAKERFLGAHVILSTLTLFLRHLKQFTSHPWGNFTLPHTFCNHLLKVLGDKAIPEWQRILEREISIYNIRYNIPVEDLKLYAHLVAKILTKGL